jgi:Asp/Glu/hydantoin racemase
MVAIARSAAPLAVIDGVTAPFGAALITTPDELDIAAQAVEAACGRLADSQAQGVIIAAFGDPGLSAARRRLAIPVTGLAEASMLAASAYGRFAVVTTTPALAVSIVSLAAQYRCEQNFAGVHVTEGDPDATMNDPARLAAALERACRAAVEKDNVAAIVMGGGPLASAARQLAGRLPVPIIEPIPAAVAHLLQSARS